MVFYGKTDVGMRRAVNQDNFIIRAYSADVLTAIVCDGMGGANGGSVASSLAAQAFMDVLDRCQKEHPLFAGMTGDELCDLLAEASVEANRTVYRKGNADQSLSGMGTTLVGCLVLPDTLYTINIGDSRMYLTGGGSIRQVTHDHSYVQYLVDIGKLTPEEAKNARNRNIITRAVGTERTANADIFSTPHAECRGEYIVLCSDGLTNYLEPEEIGSILSRCRPEDGDTLRIACEELVEKANERGGSDNITAVIASV